MYPGLLWDQLLKLHPSHLLPLPSPVSSCLAGVGPETHPAHLHAALRLGAVPRTPTLRPPVAVGVLGHPGSQPRTSHPSESRDTTPAWLSETSRFLCKLDRFRWCSAYTGSTPVIGPPNPLRSRVPSVSKRSSVSQNTAQLPAAVLSACTPGNPPVPSPKTCLFSHPLWRHLA